MGYFSLTIENDKESLIDAIRCNLDLLKDKPDYTWLISFACHHIDRLKEHNHIGYNMHKKLNQLMNKLTQAVHRKENRVGGFEEVYEVIDLINAEIEEMEEGD